MERKLAHIEKVVDIQPIVGADKIEIVTILGWKCVVKKDEFKVGDLCCYIEIDSIVPQIPYFEFMRERNYRVKTIKLRKQISQGLVIQLKDIGEVVSEKDLNALNDPSEGDDLTGYLGITKYLSLSEHEADELPLRKKHSPFIKFMTRFSWYRKITKTRSKSFPEWIKKTDEERIQNIPQIISSNKEFYITEKLDGQSATYWYKRKWFHLEFGICSRNIRKFEWDNSNWSNVAKRLDIKNKLKLAVKKYGYNIAIQGEIIGQSIQGNKYKVKDLHFYVFNVFNIDTKKYMDIFEIVRFCKEFDFIHVPLVNYHTTPSEHINIDNIIKNSEGFSQLNPNTIREGVVWRTFDQSISFKVINPTFLLSNKE